MSQDKLSPLVKMSRKYGGDPDFVLAGGGNTSYKTAKHLYIKGSGTALSRIRADEFVKMSRKLINAMFHKDYGTDEKAREERVLADLMAAREKGQEQKRPSVETMLHDLFAQRYVLHVHPAFVNALTCSKNGEAAARELFPAAIWIPACKPGYILSMICKRAFDQYRVKTGCEADILILENHGIFIAGNTLREIDTKGKDLRRKLTERIPEINISETKGNETAASVYAPVIRKTYGKYTRTENASAVFFAPAALNPFLADKAAFSIFDSPPTPDHIVYCKAKPLFIKTKDKQAELIGQAFESFYRENGYVPKIVAIQGIGAYACGATVQEANTARSLFVDEIKIICGSAAFGGYRPMSNELTDFIINWEVEAYRSKAARTADAQKRLTGKIALVTGSAQGFGKGIAERLADEGAVVVIADRNKKGAAEVALALCEKHGEGAAVAVGADVSDEDSVRRMFETTALSYGGLDIFINNAGIVRAGGLDEMDKKSFDLVTSVNYTAYFLCAKYASAIMKRQSAVCPEVMSDIIEINSKSGLAGSNRNFAYAGSKFGGIGLTQSFALELAPYGIKVNAICPGNFLDGPLWSDPDKGLFAQYLRAGKVPGAKTVADVRSFYEKKVPLGRGCETEDVVRAILYIVEQKYETGQALPVTGGQEMLR